MLKELRFRLGTFWCLQNHDSVTWPAHGQYRCLACGRRYTAFAETPVTSATNHAGLKGGARELAA